MTSFGPRGEQAFESADESHAFDFRAKREDVIAFERFRELEYLVERGDRRRVAGEKRFVERRQCRRDLRAQNDFAVDDREEGRFPATVARVGKAEALRESERVPIRFPARGSVRAWRHGKYFRKTRERFLHFCLDPGVWRAVDFLFPRDAIPGADAGFKTGLPGFSEDFKTACADFGRGKEGPAEPRFEVVIAFERTFPGFAAAVIGAEAKEETAPRAVVGKKPGQRGDAFERAVAGVDVNFERDSFYHARAPGSVSGYGSAADPVATFRSRIAGDLISGLGAFSRRG